MATTAAIVNRTVTLGGHSGEVLSVAYSPDGQTVATGSGDCTARVWDAATGQCKLTLSGHSDAVASVAFSPDGRTIATGSDDKTARVWDAATGQCKLTLMGTQVRSFRLRIRPTDRRLQREVVTALRVCGMR
eukprot:Opistho-2@94276